MVLSVFKLPISEKRKNKFIESVGTTLSIDAVDNTWDNFDYNILARDLFGAPDAPLYKAYQEEYTNINNNVQKDITEFKKKAQQEAMEYTGGIKIGDPVVRSVFSSVHVQTTEYGSKVKKEARQQKIALFKEYLSKFMETYVEPTDE